MLCQISAKALCHNQDSHVVTHAIILNMSSRFLPSLDSEGFVIIPSILKPDEIAAVRTACSDLRALAETGQWPYLRTLPKQFPPWGSDISSGIWGIQNLLHPDNPNSTLFVSTYFSNSIIDIVTDLLSCNESDLVMELYNLLITPSHDYSLRWHRDDIPLNACEEEETAKLSKPAWHTQWNLALYDDESLIVIPKSHKRARNNAERMMKPYEDNALGQKRVRLKAGDAVFYNNNILHRGVYDSNVPRMTLHGSIGHVQGGKERARNVLQHGVNEWVRRCDFTSLSSSRVRSRAEGMRERLLMLGDAQKDVGYTHLD